MAFSGIESGIAEAPPTPFKWYIRNGRNGPKAALGGGAKGQKLPFVDSYFWLALIRLSNKVGKRKTISPGSFIWGARRSTSFAVVHLQLLL